MFIVSLLKFETPPAVWFQGAERTPSGRTQQGEGLALPEGLAVDGSSYGHPVHPMVSHGVPRSSLALPKPRAGRSSRRSCQNWTFGSDDFWLEVAMIAMGISGYFGRDGSSE